MTDYSKNDVKNSVLTENTAQSVYKHLRHLKSNRADVVSRWIWELLQNARDASSGDGHLVAAVERQSDSITFQHNGRGFREKEIAHLIYHGSTKSEDASSLGQFGSGFLTTHLLSPRIEVSGQLEDRRSFRFELVRQAESREMLRRCMDAAWHSFDPSTAPLADPLPETFSTRFRYPVTTEGAAGVVAEGLQTLRSCAPLVLVFNSEFHCIRIDDLDSTTEFNVARRRSLADGEVVEVAVVKSHNDDQTEVRFLVLEAEDATIALPLETACHDEHMRCTAQNGPRLYLGFPLVGTDQFGVSAAINSFKFGPTEARDGIYVGQAEDETNRVNEQLVETALALHVKLLRFAAARGYMHSAVLATVPPIKEQSGLNVTWLRKTIQDKLIAPIRKTPSVVPAQGQPLAPEEAVIPYAADEGQVLALRRLLEGLEQTATLLPSPAEAAMWCRTIRSWSILIGDVEDPADFGEAWNGVKLAEEVAEKAGEPNKNYGKLELLRGLLVAPDSAVEWLDELCSFLMHTGSIDVLRTLNLVLDQAGCLDKLANLYRDVGIDEELKQIADDLLDIGLRGELRDERIASLRDEEGKGNYGNEQVIERILNELQKQAQQEETAGSVPTREASCRLLAWMVCNGRFDGIDHFPAWSEAHDDDEPELIWLERANNAEGELPLAPVQAWPSGLREFAGLFPRSCILAGNYYDYLPMSEQWKLLEKDHLVRTDVVLRRQQIHNFQESPPDEALADEDEEHVSADPVDVVDVTYFVKDRIGVMARVPDSPRRAVLLWRFLTEYMIPRDINSVDVTKTRCGCGEVHDYYAAAWLKPLVRNKWVPLGGKKRSGPTAQSLAKLLSEGGSSGTGVWENDNAMRLLNALGVTQLELTMASIADSDEKRRLLDANLARILTSTEGDLAPVNQFVEDLQSDDDLLDHLERRREIRRSIHRNQKLGAIVECLVKESLETEGFDVQRTGIGSDYEIEHDAVDEADGEEMGIELASEDGRKWLVEIKATQGDEVRMTQTQAKTAIERRNEFLLCVVAVGVESADLDVDRVRVAMRFVMGIGEHLGSLCSDLNDVEERRKAATENDSAYGVRLEILRGKARICVEEALWRDAIPLDGLVTALGDSAG